jgi:uncharacterized protein YkwD
MTRLNQVTFTSILGSLALAACIPITIPPGALHPVRPWPANATCPVPARSASDAETLVALMNAERRKAGLAPLDLSDKVSAVAHAFACDIADRRDIDHTGSDGSLVSERLMRGGLAPLYVAENTAEFYRTPEEAMAAWMASPHHRDNILRREVTTVGVGLADTDKAYWVVDFTS